MLKSHFHFFGQVFRGKKSKMTNSDKMRFLGGGFFGVGKRGYKEGEGVKRRYGKGLGVKRRKRDYASHLGKGGF